MSTAGFPPLICSLYEIGSTPQDKLTMLTHGFRPADVAGALGLIDVSKAGCFDAAARQLIVREIERQHGSLDAFTIFLKLRLLLMPLTYERDVEALLARSRDSFRFPLLRAGLSELHPAPGVLCVAAGSGEGKSTLSAALTRFAAAEGGAPFLAAWHFCKAEDARRQDSAEVSRSLACQLARRFPQFAAALLALPAARVRAVQRADEAVELLVAAPLRALPPEQRKGVVILFDALDEAQPHGGGGGGGTLQNEVLRIVAAVQQAGAAVVCTTRPEPNILAALRGRLPPGAFLLRSPADYLITAEAAATTTSGQSKPLPEKLRAALAAHAGNKVFCVVAQALFEAHGDKDGFCAPSSLPDAYEATFELGWPPKDSANEKAVRRLLEVLLAAREPPSVAALELLGVRQALPLLPGFGTLFQLHSFHCFFLHKCVGHRECASGLYL